MGRRTTHLGCLSGFGRRKAKIGRSEDSFYPISKPIAPLWVRKRVKNGPLRSMCSQRFPSPTGAQRTPWPSGFVDDAATLRVLVHLQREADSAGYRPQPLLELLPTCESVCRGGTVTHNTARGTTD